MAPVLVPPRKSNHSASLSRGLSVTSRRTRSKRLRICREMMPRIPPPSRERIRLGPGATMRSVRVKRVLRPCSSHGGEVCGRGGSHKAVQTKSKKTKPGGHPSEGEPAAGRPRTLKDSDAFAAIDMDFIYLERSGRRMGR